MATPTQTETTQTRNRLSRQRGNFYYGLGFALVIGLLAIVGLGLLGITSLGILSASTAFAMVAIAILLISAVSVITLLTLRRTIALLSRHEKVLQEQSRQQAALAAKVQSHWRAEQAIRDRNQDAALAAVVARPTHRFARPGGATLVKGNGAARRPAARYDPFGDVHPVRDIEGIGEHYGALLDDMGIEDTQKLWNANVNDVATGVDVNPAAVDDWQNMAELMAVTGIGKQYAELLVRAGVTSIDQLRVEKVQPLLARIARVQKSQKNRIQGNTIGTKAVKSWIGAAKSHKGSRPFVAVVKPKGA